MFTETTVAKMTQLYTEKQQSIEHVIMFSNNKFERLCAELVRDIATGEIA